MGATAESDRSAIAKIARASSGGIVTLDSAALALEIDRHSASRRLSALVRAGWLSRVRRAVYSIRPLDASRVMVASVERTIVDACAHPDWVGGGRQLVSIFRAAVDEGLVTPDTLLAGAHGAPTGAALGRLAILVERYLPDASNVIAYATSHRGKGYVRFDPATKKNGPLNTRWGVWLNVSFGDTEG